MANIERGEVLLVVGEREYTLRPTTNAIRDIERRLGKSYGQIIQALDTYDIDALTHMMFAVLQPHHAREFKTPNDVGTLIDAGGGINNTRIFSAALTEMLLANMPPKPPAGGDGDVPNPPRGRDGIGGNSGLTPDVSA